MSEKVEFTIFFDFGCPWVYRIARFLNFVREEGTYDPVVTWRAFPLEQVNAPDGPEWGLWEKESRIRSKGRAAFEAAFAAKRQGDEAFKKFHWGLLRARWEEDLDLGRRASHLAVAEEAGLDLAKFEQDLDDPALLAEVGEDYTFARNTYGVFGTPTVVFPNGGAAYLKVTADFPKDGAKSFFEDFVSTVRDRPTVLEIKRPFPPQPAS